MNDVTYDDPIRAGGKPYKPTGDNLTYSDHVQTYYKFVRGFWIISFTAAAIVVLLAFITL